MQIVTDSGTDLLLSPEEMEQLKIHVLPLRVTLDGVTYRDKIDIQPEGFFPLLESSKELPLTSQPAVGEFVELYRKLAKDDPEILSIHMSSGLSGTYNAARTAASMVPEAHVTVVDTHTLSAPSAWQVEAAAKAAAKGWSKEKILAGLMLISDATDVVFTLKELKYLIHGGRISHLKGLIGSLLNIKPIIGVEKVHGTYVQRGQTRSFSNAVKNIEQLIRQKLGEGSPIRVQVVHAQNLEGAQALVEEINQHFKCHWLPTSLLSQVLSAHVGPTMIGIAYAPEEVFTEMDL